MFNLELVDYIKKEINRGQNRDQIVPVLIEAGWNNVDIIKAFDLVEGNTSSANFLSKKRLVGTVVFAFILILIISVFGFFKLSNSSPSEDETPTLKDTIKDITNDNVENVNHITTVSKSTQESEDQKIIDTLIEFNDLLQQYSVADYGVYSDESTTKNKLGNLTYFKYDKEVCGGWDEEFCLRELLKEMSYFGDFDNDFIDFNKYYYVNYDDKQAVVAYFKDLDSETSQKLPFESNKVLYFFYLIKEDGKWLVGYNNTKNVSMDLIALGVPHLNDEDSDKDGLTDYLENCYNIGNCKLNPDNPDIDNDGWWDGIETLVLFTSPTEPN